MYSNGISASVWLKSAIRCTSKALWTDCLRTFYQILIQDTSLQNIKSWDCDYLIDVVRARGIWSKRDTQVHPVTMFGCVSIFFRAINGSINQVQTGHLIRGRGRLNSRLVSCASPRNLLNVSNHTSVIFWPHSSYYTAWCWWCDRSKCPVNQFLPQIWVSSRKPSSSSPPHRSWMMWLFKSKQPQPLKHSNFTFDSSLQSESQYS